MSEKQQIEYGDIGRFYFDPLNPRLSLPKVELASQPEIRDVLEDYSLAEIAQSIVESGYWPQEALVVVQEDLYGEEEEKLVVIEGNRRLAALQLLSSGSQSKKWNDLRADFDKSITQAIPYIRVKSRKDAQAFLGYRHVTGVKEWRPAEKAQFITELRDKYEMSFDEIRKKIGSKRPAVFRHYQTFKLLEQMDEIDEIDVEKVSERFSVLYLSLRSDGVRNYIGLVEDEDPSPDFVPAANPDKLANFVRWVFGTTKTAPLFSDSRSMDLFGRALGSPEAVGYLEDAARPSADYAIQISGAEQQDIVADLNRTVEYLGRCLSRIHRYRSDKTIIKQCDEIADDAAELKARAHITPETE